MAELFKGKDTKLGNAKSVGMKTIKTTGAAAGRVKTFVEKDVSAIQQSDTPEEGTARFAEEESRQIFNEAKDGVKYSVKKTGSELKTRVQTSLKRKSSGLSNTSSKAVKETGRSARGAAQNAVKSAEKTVQTTAKAANQSVQQTVKATGHGMKSAAHGSVKMTSWAAKSTAKMTSWAAQSAAKMTAWSTKVATEAAAKAAVKTAEVTAKATAKAAQMSAKAAAYSAKAAATAGKVAVTAVAAMLKTLIAFIVSGGWILLLILFVIALFYVLISSVSGMVYTVDEEGDYNALVTEVSALTENYYYQAETQLDYFRAAYTVGDMPPTIIFEGASVSSDGGELFYVQNMHDVMAVFYTEIMSGVSDVETLNYLTDARKERLQEIFRDMNSLNIVLDKAEEIRDEPAEGQVLGELRQYIIHVRVERRSLTANQAANNYGFDTEQKELLAEFMTEEAYALISVAIGTSADGSLHGIRINPNMPISVIGNTIVQSARRYLGRSYAMMDCSALVRKAYQDVGLDWSGTSTAMAKECINRNCVIDESQLQPGDLIFWRSDIGGGRCGNSHCSGGVCQRWGQIHHVAIYVGNGKLIESATGGVAERDIWETTKWKIAFYARPYVQAPN